MQRTRGRSLSFVTGSGWSSCRIRHLPNAVTHTSVSFSPLEQGQHNNYAQALGHYTDVGAYSWVRVIGIYPLAWLQPAVSSQCKCRRVTGTWRLLWMPCLALSAWLRRQPASCPASGGYGHSRIMHGCHASPCWTKRESPTCCLFSTRSRCAVLPRCHAKFGGRLCPKSRRPSRIRRSETMGI